LPRKVARQRSYDIPFVGVGIKPVALGKRDIDRVARILGRQPSQEFKAAYCYILAVYDAYRKSVSNSNAAAVQRRIGAVVASARTLQKSLSKLELTDKTLINRFVTRRFLLELKYTGLNELAEKLDHFVPVIEEAIGIVTKESKQGRMPALAEQALAKDLCQILFEETRTTPTTKRGDTFDLLLRRAFAQAPNPRHLIDVVDLMRFSLKEKPKDRWLLSNFRTANGTGRPTAHSDTGINKAK
jgi:hypothetical protein